MSNINMYITNRCNLNCLHCFRSDDQQGDLPIDVAKKIVGEAQALGFKNVSLTGGEPALYPDIEELIAYISHFGSMTYSVMTNGLEAAPLIQLIKKYRAGFSLLGVSLDDLPGSDRTIRDRSLHEVYEQAFQLCRDNDIPFQIKTCVSSEYANRVDEFLSLAQKNGASSIEFSTIMPSQKAVANDLIMSMKHRTALMLRITKLSHQTSYPIFFARELFMPNPLACDRQRMHVFCFDIEGNLVFCTCLSDYIKSTPRLLIGNIVKTSMKELIVAYHLRQHEFLETRMARYDDYARQNRLYDYHTCMYCYAHFGQV